MSCLVRCPSCGAGKRFEHPHGRVTLFQDGGMYVVPPVTRRVECPCGDAYVVQLPARSRVPVDNVNTMGV